MKMSTNPMISPPISGPQKDLVPPSTITESSEIVYGSPKPGFKLFVRAMLTPARAPKPEPIAKVSKDILCKFTPMSMSSLPVLGYCTHGFSQVSVARKEIE